MEMVKLKIIKRAKKKKTKKMIKVATHYLVIGKVDGVHVKMQLPW